jgi:bifunctional non-homologous end joining protein LigD
MLRPMLASLSDAPLTDPDLIYEPKYDGIRAIVEIEGPRIRLWSRLGNEKTAQFPEIVDALRHWSRRRREPLILDGEIVALDRNGEPTGFQQLQGRIHLTAEKGGEKGVRPLFPTALIAFDVLREGRTDFLDRPLTERRKALERIFGRARSPTLRISESVRGDGRALYKRALERGWEGLIAKHADSRYKAGKRTPDWRKLKIVHEQEFVIGGWTEPRQTRSYFGALLLGVYETERLVYVGHTGTGFNEAELARLMKLLKPLETKDCPFPVRPKTNEPPHWVQPRLVAQIKFTEWTADGSLRHPVYLGLRDDKKPEEVVREPVSRLHAGSTRLTKEEPGSGFRVQSSGVVGRNPAPRTQNPARTQSPEPRTKNPGGGTQNPAPGTSNPALLAQLRDLETSRRDGTIDLPDGDRLSVSNLHKVFWPKQKLTKGDLLRYYVEAAPFILPAIDDRPLTMKRYPNGIEKEPFYQHRAPDHVPPNVRVEHVPGEKTVPARFIGGGLKTLLYMTQLASISQDPWFSRVASPGAADHVALDLDPADGVTFARVLDVARWIHDELDHLGAMGVPKTSGADGLHIYIPLPAGTPYDAGQIFCQIIATVVAQKHPKVATVERSVRARGPRVYVDYLQNIQGKTLATAYSARASGYAGVSMPLTWSEVDEGVRREDFTIRTAPARLRQVGDLWKALRTSKGVDLSRVSKYTNR